MPNINNFDLTHTTFAHVEFGEPLKAPTIQTEELTVKNDDLKTSKPENAEKTEKVTKTTSNET